MYGKNFNGNNIGWFPASYVYEEGADADKEEPICPPVTSGNGPVAPSFGLLGPKFASAVSASTGSAFVSATSQGAVAVVADAGDGAFDLGALADAVDSNNASAGETTVSKSSSANATGSNSNSGS